MEKHNKSKIIISIALKIILLVFGYIGQVYTYSTGNFMSVSHFMYFTNQSNILIMFIVFIFLIYDIIALTNKNNLHTPPQWLYALRYIFTVSITLTFIVFSLLLTPQMIATGFYSYLYSVSNICVHNIVPILAVTDWYLYAYPYKTNKNSFYLSLIMPIYYSVFVFALSFRGNYFSGKKVPYFFFDYEANGWFKIANGSLGVVWWVIILCIGVLLIGKFLIKLKNRREKKTSAV